MADFSCPDCGTPLQRMECGGALQAPQDGDVGVCGTCFSVLEFYKLDTVDPLEDVKVRSIPLDEIEAMSPRDKAVLRATRDRAALVLALSLAGPQEAVQSTAPHRRHP